MRWILSLGLSDFSEDVTLNRSEDYGHGNDGFDRLILRAKIMLS